MKKLFTGLALGMMLMGGFLFVQDNSPKDVAINELEPSVLSVQMHSVFM